MISIITINYNNAEGLLKTLNSMDNQICANKFEHIIVDGGSHDASKSYIYDYANTNANVKWVSEPDNGIYNAMNKGIKMSSGKFIAFLNSGDILAYKNSLQKLINTLNNNSSTDFLYANIDIIDNFGKIKRKWLSGKFSMLKLNIGWMPPHPMTTIRKSIIVKYSGFDENYAISSDYDLMLRILLNKKLNIKYINCVMVKMEEGGISNSSMFKILGANLEVLKSWYKIKGFRVPFWIFLLKPLSKLSQYKNY